MESLETELCSKITKLEKTKNIGMNRDQRPSPGYKLIPSPLPFATKICWIVCEVWVPAFFPLIAHKVFNEMFGK
jgi:hypothetical protein